MEFRELAFELDQIDEADLEVRLSGAFIISASFGSLVALRNFLDEHFQRGLIHYQISNEKLYTAKYHELSNEKAIKLEEAHRHGRGR
jgi:hypothetical protein